MKILFISPWFPYPSVNGSKIRISHLLRAIAEHHEVRLISFVREGELVDPTILEQSHILWETVPLQEFAPNRLKALLGFFSNLPRSILVTYSKGMAASIREQMGEFHPDLAIFSELGTAIYRPDIPICCILDEIQISVGYDAWRKEGNFFRKWRSWLTWVKNVSYIRRVLPGFSACTFASEIEQQHIKEILPDYSKISVIPNGVDIEYHHPGLVEAIPYTLVYNGSLTYSANFDAVEFFLARIMPNIIEQFPQTRLYVTGSTQGVNISGLQSRDHLELTGYLNDIRPTVASAWACVVPLRIGGGTRLKILEAMALGTPVIATSKGIEGLDVTPEQDCLIASDPDTFADQVIRLLQDPVLRKRLVSNGRKLVEQKYSWLSIGKEFENLISQVTEGCRHEA